MNLVLLRLIRNILFKTVVISIALTSLMALSTIALWDTWSALACKWFHMSPEAIGPVILAFFAQIKFFYIFVLLAPALALHWTITTQEKNG